MEIKEIRKLTELTQENFSEKYHVPLPTLRHWERGDRTCPDYVVELLEFKVREDSSMKKMHELILERLNTKRNELSERKEQFEVMWHNERNSGCFERNAISDLVIMQQLKSEISELEHWETLTRVQIEK